VAPGTDYRAAPGPERALNLPRDLGRHTMPCLQPVLESYAMRVTRELEPRLRGVFGGIIRHYLPQEWILDADGEVYTIAVDPQGRCRVHAGASPSPDVTIRVGHDRLRAALERREKAPANGSYRVTFQTRKGETAFHFLRERFGL
jgi:hypothetical protein